MKRVVILMNNKGDEQKAGGYLLGYALGAY